MNIGSKNFCYFFLKNIWKIKIKELSLQYRKQLITKIHTTMTRRYYYYVTINNCNSCEFDSLKEAKDYVESMRNDDGSYSYSVTNSKGETFKMKAEIELKKRWEHVGK